MPSNDELHSWAIHASRAWPLLTFAARNRHVFSYEELGEHLGLPTVAVGHALGPIYRYCKAKGLPLLNLIVVNKTSGGADPDREQIGQYDIPSEQARVFRHKWFNESNHADAVPKVEELQKFLDRAAAAT